MRPGWPCSLTLTKTITQGTTSYTHPSGHRRAYGRRWVQERSSAGGVWRLIACIPNTNHRTVSMRQPLQRCCRPVRPVASTPSCQDCFDLRRQVGDSYVAARQVSDVPVARVCVLRGRAVNKIVLLEMRSRLWECVWSVIARLPLGHQRPRRGRAPAHRIIVPRRISIRTSVSTSAVIRPGSNRQCGAGARTLHCQRYRRDRATRRRTRS